MKVNVKVIEKDATAVTFKVVTGHLQTTSIEYKDKMTKSKKKLKILKIQKKLVVVSNCGIMLQVRCSLIFIFQDTAQKQYHPLHVWQVRLHATSQHKNISSVSMLIEHHIRQDFVHTLIRSKGISSIYTIQKYLMCIMLFFGFHRIYNFWNFLKEAVGLEYKVSPQSSY